MTQATVLALAGLVFGVPLGIAVGRVTWQLVAHATRWPTIRRWPSGHCC
jgi:hypothetical protein